MKIQGEEFNKVKRRWIWWWFPLRGLLHIFSKFEVGGGKNLENLKPPFIVVIAPHYSLLDPHINGLAVPLRFISQLFPFFYMGSEKTMEKIKELKKGLEKRR